MADGILVIRIDRFIFLTGIAFALGIAASLAVRRAVAHAVFVAIIWAFFWACEVAYLVARVVMGDCEAFGQITFAFADFHFFCARTARRADLCAIVGAAFIVDSRADISCQGICLRRAD